MELKNKSKIEAVIFDMDGLLIDSEPLWREATIKVFKEIGVSLTEKQCEETMGFRVDEFVEYWLIKYEVKEIKEEIIANRIIEELINLILLKGKIMDGVNDIINLFEKEGITMALASSSPMNIIEAVLEKIKIKDKIKFIFSAENELFGKPHPGIYISAAKNLNVPVSKCLAFEDSPNGVLSAKAAKMKCVAVPDSINMTDKRFGIADLIIISLKDFSLKDLVSL